MIKFIIFLVIFGMNSISRAEFNIVNNDGRSAYINQGYRNVIKSFFLYTDNESENYFEKNKVTIPYDDFSITINPSLHHNNKIKGEKYYFTNYDILISLGNKKYKLPFFISDASGVGVSIIFNDNNIVVFSVESYVSPVSNNDSKKFTSEIFILNKNNLGIYNPVFLNLNSKLKKVNEIPLKFSKLKSIDFNKKDYSYKIVYEVQKALEDFSATGKVVYQKKPLTYSFDLKLDKKEPFLVSNFIEKSEGTHKVIKSNGYEQMYMDFLK